LLRIGPAEVAANQAQRKFLEQFVGHVRIAGRPQKVAEGGRLIPHHEGRLGGGFRLLPFPMGPSHQAPGREYLAHTLLPTLRDQGAVLREGSDPLSNNPFLSRHSPWHTCLSNYFQRILSHSPPPLYQRMRKKSCSIFSRPGSLQMIL